MSKIEPQPTMDAIFDPANGYVDGKNDLTFKVLFEVSRRDNVISSDCLDLKNPPNQLLCFIDCKSTVVSSKFASNLALEGSVHVKRVWIYSRVASSVPTSVCLILGRYIMSNGNLVHGCQIEAKHNECRSFSHASLEFCRSASARRGHIDGNCLQSTPRCHRSCPTIRFAHRNNVPPMLRKLFEDQVHIIIDRFPKYLWSSAPKSICLIHHHIHRSKFAIIKFYLKLLSTIPMGFDHQIIIESCRN